MYKRQHTDQILEIVSYLQNELEGINAETENMITMLNTKAAKIEALIAKYIVAGN